MIVYIASPYTEGDKMENVCRQIDAADEIRDAGHLPYAPLLFHFWHILIPHDYDYWTAMDLEWVRKAEVLVRLPGDSRGADAEVAEAQRLGISVYYSVESFLEAFSLSEG